jgi:hypothetical protein
MSEGKTVPVKVRVAWDELTTLNNLCVANGWKQADAIRMAIHEFNIKKTKELKTNQTWSPVQEYNLQNEPGL